MLKPPARQAQKGRRASPQPVVRGRTPRKSAESPNKHQLRTEETRRRLLNAAAKVFSKVGFEAARLEDIAKEAMRLASNKLPIKTKFIVRQEAEGVEAE